MTSRSCRATSRRLPAFENAMALDVAMGGSTNTVLHILAAAQEAEIDFDLHAIDAISRRVPCLAKVARTPHVLHGDVHRAGGIPAILGELDRAGLLNRNVPVHAPSLERQADWDIRSGTATDAADRALPRRTRRRAHRRTVLDIEPVDSLDTDAADGCIPRQGPTPTPSEGGLCVLHGNLALRTVRC